MLSNRLYCLLVLSLVSTSIFAQKKGTLKTVNKVVLTEEALRQKAIKLAQGQVMVDGHVDLPYRLWGKMEDVSVQTPTGDFDYVRAKKGGLSAPFMSIYVPAYRQKKAGSAKIFADSLIDMVENLAKQFPDKFALAKSPADIMANFKKGLISLPMGMENGAPVESNLENLKHFHKRGVRYITLCHGEDNFICDTSYDTTGTWRGLSPLGFRVVGEMNRLGMMIDVSHISDESFYQVVKYSKAPVIASHSSCRKFTPGFRRNMADDMIKLMAQKGGVIMINYSSMFLDSASNASYEQKRLHLQKWQRDNNLTADAPQARAYEEEYSKAHPIQLTGVARVADHIDHVVAIVGINHVGLGSDFDGVGPTLPQGLKDCSEMPNLIYELLKRGYTEAQIQKICYGNIFRVWQKVESISRVK
jgi:membrane dipeptidase